MYITQRILYSRVGRRAKVRQKYVVPLVKVWKIAIKVSSINRPLPQRCTLSGAMQYIRGQKSFFLINAL
jgi:hypothetical protein